MLRILVRAPNWIGDQVMAYPFFAELKKQYPKSWITVVATPWVASIQFRGYIDEVIVLEKPKSRGVWAKFKSLVDTAKKIREAGPFDLAITLPNSFGAALLFFLARIPQRRGYATDGRDLLLTDPVTWDPDPEFHRADAYLGLVPKDQPHLVPAKNYWAVEAKPFDPIMHWATHLPFEPPLKPYVVVAPGATADSRRWSTDRFAEFSKRMIARGFDVVVVGGPAEAEITREWIKKGMDVINTAGLGDVAQTWKLFRNAQFTLCNESGLAHVASLCGSSVHIVCGAADPRRTKPIGPGPVINAVNPIPCWPCEKNQCEFEGNRKNACLEGISVDRIVLETLRYLNSPGVGV